MSQARKPKGKKKEIERYIAVEWIPQHEVFHSYISLSSFLYAMQISSWDNSIYGKSYHKLENQKERKGER